MAGSLNKVMLIGRLTRDPELRYLPSGQAVCQLAMATNRYTTDQGGERKEFTDYHDIVVWNQGNRKLADLCGQYLAKGRLVYVEGRIQTRSWDDKETGAKRYRTEINANDVQFLERGQGGEGNDGEASAFTARPAATPASVGAAANGEPGGDLDPDDIPF